MALSAFLLLSAAVYDASDKTATAVTLLAASIVVAIIERYAQ